MNKVYIKVYPYTFTVFIDGVPCQQETLVIENLLGPEDRIYFEGKIINEDDNFIYLELDTSEDEDETMRGKNLVFELYKQAISIDEFPDQLMMPAPKE